MNIWTKLAEFAVIDTERLRLRPFSYQDAEDFYAIASNPKNLEFIFPSQASIEESQYVLANYFMRNPLGVWAICDKESQRMIGSIKFEKLDEIKKEAGNLAKSEEDVLTYAMFPQVAQTYFEKRDNPEKEVKVQTINVIF